MKCMKCMKCNKNEANVYISTNINGKIKKECLCQECAKNMDMHKYMSINMDKMFAKMINNRAIDVDSMMIPSRMHNVFNEDMFFNDFFDDIKGFDRFFDRLNFNGSTDKMVEDTVRIDKENRIDRKQEQNSDNSIKTLQFELEKAIKEERYEDAAVLRDKIKGIM